LKKKIMEKLGENISELNALIIQGRPMEAFEKFYHDDVVMQENDAEPMRGKAANRKREEEFFAATEFRREEVLDVAVGNNVTMVRWAMDFTHKDWGDRNYTQVSVQHWSDGKIIREQFFYGN